MLLKKKIIWIFFSFLILLLCFGLIIYLNPQYRDLNNLPFIAGGEWSIGIYTGDSLLGISPPSDLRNPVLIPENVTDMPARQLADPFMIKTDSLWYLFFEVVHARTNQGNIGYATSADGLNWTYRKVILDEPFHLSYPDVFKWDSNYYMIPESNEARTVRLYRASPFPSHWDFIGNLIHRVLVDPTFLAYDGRCWIFAASVDRKDLYLFYADSLTGPWTEHPENPIKKNNTRSAPAGRIISMNNELIRFTMDVTDDYGKMVRAFQIDTLTTTIFREHEITQSPVLEPSGSGWNADRMHQFDPHQLSDSSWIACVDGWRKVIQFGWKY